MKKLIILTVVAIIIGGCHFANKQKDEGYQRWYQTRARLECSVGVKSFEAGDLDSAKASAAAALTLDKDYYPARILLAKVFLEDGRYVEATDELLKVEPHAPDNPEVPYLIGVAMEKRGEYAEAVKSYQKAAALDPANDAYVTASAEALAIWGKPKLALELLETCLEGPGTGATGPIAMLAAELAMLVDDPAKAAKFYQRCVDARSDDLAAREGLAKACFFAGRPAEALAALETLAAHPDYREKASWVYLMMGDSLMTLDRSFEARRAYETATRIDPDDGRAWVAAAKGALAAGEVSRAAFAARRAIELGGDCNDAKIILACAMLAEGKPAEGAKLLAAEARKTPADATTLCVLGRCYASMGRADQAAGCYVRVLQSDPDHRLAKKLLAQAGM